MFSILANGSSKFQRRYIEKKVGLDVRKYITHAYSSNTNSHCTKLAREISKVEFGRLTFLLLDPLSLIAGVDCFASVMIFSDEDVSAVEYIVIADGLPKERNVNCVILYIVKLTKP